LQRWKLTVLDLPGGGGITSAAQSPASACMKNE
jgi:hypothetical protein